MEASGQNERYDSFDEYSSNKDIYERIRSEIGGDDYDSFPSGVLQEKEVNIDFIKKDCLKLRRYLINFNTKENCIKKNCCQYINYFLNNTIRDQYSSDSSIFSIYKTYMNHDSNSNIKSLCGSEINYMELNKYEKTKNLYITYDLYKIFISDNYGTLCSQANSCSKAYNNVKTLYPELNDTKFCKALVDFKKFTPLGHWLRPQTQRFNGISEQFDGEQYDIQQHNSEFEEQNTEYDGYNITYSSL
ncbi:PIR Superfamily Protein [Plasmodium ovale wallikeri]|uniref:PIR Superfamily Protein n=1 Tax=Plasmodium ovale wallikeri TaxID=864142 RepID=A0A1A9AJR1_PLAOA|nr:PIR Superfamily Protein [Plasmodium ovale wallikeri]